MENYWKTFLDFLRASIPRKFSSKILSQNSFITPKKSNVITIIFLTTKSMYFLTLIFYKQIVVKRGKNRVVKNCC